MTPRASRQAGAAAADAEVGGHWAREPRRQLVADLQVRVLTEDGELIRELILDPTRDYQRRT